MTDSNDSTTPLELVGDAPPADGPAAELPRQMGRDARRVARGELSEETFYDRYHEQMVERFGFDRRPGGDGG
jgi:hypothetical protein